MVLIYLTTIAKMDEEIKILQHKYETQIQKLTDENAQLRQLVGGDKTLQNSSSKETITISSPRVDTPITPRKTSATSLNTAPPPLVPPPSLATPPISTVHNSLILC